MVITFFISVTVIADIHRASTMIQCQVEHEHFTCNILCNPQSHPHTYGFHFKVGDSGLREVRKIAQDHIASK